MAAFGLQIKGPIVPRPVVDVVTWKMAATMVEGGRLMCWLRQGAVDCCFICFALAPSNHEKSLGLKTASTAWVPFTAF